MEETIKSKEVIAYKGMEFDMTCLGFQYEVGKTYKTDKAKLCECGFHACLNPLDVLYYYQDEDSHYFKVKLSGEIANCDESDTKVAATEITILEEITDIFDEVTETTEWWKHENVLDLLPWTEGFAKIQRGDGLYNFINKKGNYLSNEWFNYLGDFHEGFASVQRGDKLYNFIDKQGNYISNEWFNYVFYFREGFAVVQRGDKLCNFIDKKGNILSNEWFKVVSNFNEGFAIVKRSDDLYNFIGKNGNYLSDEWFKNAFGFNKGLAKVQKTNNCWCEIDTSGKVVNNAYIS